MRNFRENNDNDYLGKYLKEIGEAPLLSREEEAELAKRIRQGDRKAFEKLVKANLRFVVSVAKQYQHQGVSLEDLINEGNLGLIKAAKRFDETRGFKFISYAVWWVRQAILQALAEQSRVTRLPLNRVGALCKIRKVVHLLEQEFWREPTAEEIAKEMALTPKEVEDTLKITSGHLSFDKPFGESEDSSLLDILEDESQPAPDKDAMNNSLKREIERVLKTLSPREAHVITQYFGLNNDRPKTLEQVGREMRLTRERIRQIKERAIRRLRYVSRSKLLRQYLE